MWENYRGRFYTIREYVGDFSFYLDNKSYSVSAQVPQDFINYNYLVKMNMDNTNYFQILSLPYSIPADFNIPVSGFTNNPTSMIRDYLLLSE